MKKKKTIKGLIRDKQPFAVVKYKVWMRGIKSEINNAYEIMFEGKSKKTTLIVIDDVAVRIPSVKQVIKTKSLSASGIKALKTNLSLLQEKANTSDGIVWEFMDFKNFYRFNKQTEIQ